jgi:uncharacterized protein with PIN domain
VTARSTGGRRGARLREREARYDVAGGPVVVDASMAVSWFANEPDARDAARLLERESMLLAPDVMAVEATNAWWKKLRRHDMTLVEVEDAVTRHIPCTTVSISRSQRLAPRSLRRRTSASDRARSASACASGALAASSRGTLR